MIHVKDLYFREEILPLLDFLNNDRSLDVLQSVFTTIPTSIDEIRERQLILKGFIAQTKKLRLPVYGRSEFNEVYHYLQQPTNLASSQNKWWSLFVSKSTRYTEAGKLTQAIILLNKLLKSYFTSLDIAPFPENFRIKINNLAGFLSRLPLEMYEQRSRERGLSVKDIRQLKRILFADTDSGSWQVFWNDLFLMEAYLSVATGIEKKGFCFPEFTNQNFEIKELYHPILKDPVKNDFPFSKNIALLTGPNMSGKSTLLKAVGLCVYMAHLGLAVPATICKVPWFQTISIGIHHTDDIKNGYSHFMSELKTLKQIVLEAKSGKPCFAVFDELFSGTNMEDAIEILQQTLAGLSQFQHSYFIVSTHLLQLKNFTTHNAHIYPCYIDYVLTGERPGYTYQLKPGWSDLKLGKVIFKQEGLDTLLEP